MSLTFPAHTICHSDRPERVNAGCLRVILSPQEVLHMTAYLLCENSHVLPDDGLNAGNLSGPLPRQQGMPTFA